MMVPKIDTEKADYMKKTLENSNFITQLSVFS